MISDSSKCCERQISLAVQWLRLCARNAGDVSSIPDQGVRILHATSHGQKKKHRGLVDCMRQGNGTGSGWLGHGVCVSYFSQDGQETPL